MNGSKNVTVGLVVLGYYLTQAYLPTLAQWVSMSHVERWHLAIAYWLLAGVVFSRFGYCFVIVFASVACDVLVILQQPGPGSAYSHWTGMFRGLSTQFLAPSLLIFVFCPLAFFASTFDSYNLVKDVAAISNRRFPAYLLSLFSFIALTRIRFGDISENLRVRN